MKRALDLLVAILGLLILSPVLLACALLVRAHLGSPVIYRQVRPGKNGALFTLYKLRTMTSETDSDGQLLPDDQRLPALGRCLRRLSLDEIPQLWNVLRGELSLVGPRPLLVDYLPLYTAEQARRHSVRPGITGWAQIHGRNALDWDQKFRLDLWYVDNRSMWLDLKILWLTMGRVWRRQGIGHGESNSMPRFTGAKTGDGNGHN